MDPQGDGWGAAVFTRGCTTWISCGTPVARLEPSLPAVRSRPTTAPISRMPWRSLIQFESGTVATLQVSPFSPQRTFRQAFGVHFVLERGRPHLRSGRDHGERAGQGRACPTVSVRQRSRLRAGLPHRVGELCRLGEPGCRAGADRLGRPAMRRDHGGGSTFGIQRQAGADSPPPNPGPAGVVGDSFPDPGNAGADALCSGPFHGRGSGLRPAGTSVRGQLPGPASLQDFPRWGSQPLPLHGRKASRGGGRSRKDTCLSATIGSA